MSPWPTLYLKIDEKVIELLLVAAGVEVTAASVKDRTDKTNTKKVIWRV